MGPDSAAVESPERRSTFEPFGRGLPRRLGVNVVAYYLTVVASGLAAVVTTPLLVHYLGTSAYGVWMLVGSVIVYLELLELGVGAATTKLVAEHVKSGGPAVLQTLNTNMFVLGVFGCLSLALGLVLAPAAIDWFNIPQPLHHAAYVSLVIMTVAISISIPFDALGGALTAYERVDLLSFSNMVRALAASTGGAITAVLGGGIVAVTLVTAVCGISVHYLRWRLLARLVEGLRLSPTLVTRPTLRLTASLSGWFMLRDATSVVITRLDLVVVGVFLDIRAVAAYSIALKLSQASIRALQPFTTLFFPRASALSASGDAEGLRALLVDGTRVSVAVAMPVTLTLALLAEPALVAWVGDDFGDAATVLVLLAVARGLASLTETAWWMLGGAGHIKRTSALSLIEAAVNLGSSVVLAQVWGAPGVAAGSLIGVVSARLPVALTVAGPLTGMSTATFIRAALLPHLIPTMVTAAALVGTSLLLPETVMGVLVAASGAFVLYVALYLSTGAPASERARAFAVVNHLLRRSGTRSAAHPPTWTAPTARAVTTVAVCVCTYRRPAGLRRLLEAIADIYPDDEVPLSDGSTLRLRIVVADNDAAGPRRNEVHAFGRRWPGRVDYIVQPRRGIAQARNAAVSAVGADVDAVAFIDDDEAPCPGWLEQLVATWRRTGCDVVTGPVLPELEGEPPRWMATGGFFDRPRYDDGTRIHYAWTSNVLVRRELFTIADPPFDERLGLSGGEDTFFFRRAHLQGAVIMWADGARVIEYVPATRSRATWLLRREYRRGNTLSLVLVFLEGSPAARRAKRLGHAVVAFTHGCLLLVTTPVRGRIAIVAGAQRICFAGGLLAGMLGRVFEEYGEVDGD
jgi:succinoglycan biosynthesis protein ExoM